MNETPHSQESGSPSDEEASLNQEQRELTAEDEAVISLIQEMASDLERKVAIPESRMANWDSKSMQAMRLLRGVENPTGNLLLIKRLLDAISDLIRTEQAPPDLDELLDAAAMATAGTDFEYER